mmetsp:Transcript_35421/g.82150  ORF Transcript_35421/g.82150 Transcript_35421/m.82150 type:complete len:657 (+) Transcript_35421:392-2362(+)
MVQHAEFHEGLAPFHVLLPLRLRCLGASNDLLGVSILAGLDLGFEPAAGDGNFFDADGAGDVVQAFAGLFEFAVGLFLLFGHFGGVHAGQFLGVHVGEFGVVHIVGFFSHGREIFSLFQGFHLLFDLDQFFLGPAALFRRQSLRLGHPPLILRLFSHAGVLLEFFLRDPFQLLLPSFDDVLSFQSRGVLGPEIGLDGGVGGGPVLLCLCGIGRLQIRQHRPQPPGQHTQLRAHRSVPAIVSEADAPRPMVDATAGATGAHRHHHSLLDVLKAEAESGGEVPQGVQGDGVVDGAQAAHEFEEDDAGDDVAVASDPGLEGGGGLFFFFGEGGGGGVCGGGADGFHVGAAFLDEGEGIVGFLHLVVEVAQMVRYGAQESACLEFGEEGGAGGVGVEAEEGGHAGGFFLGDFVFGGGQGAGGAVGGGVGGSFHGDAERGQEDAGGHAGAVFFRHVAGEFPTQGVVFIPGVGMEEIIFRDPENIGEFFVIEGHEFGTGSASRYLHDGVNIFHRAEAFVVLIQGGGDLQLFEARVQMKFDGVCAPSFPSSKLAFAIVHHHRPRRHRRRLRLRILHIPSVPLQRPQMHPQHLAQPPKLRPPPMLRTEPERPHRRPVVHVLQPRIGPQNVQNRPVRLPLKLQRRQHHRRLPPIVVRIRRHRPHH